MIMVYKEAKWVTQSRYVYDKVNKKILGVPFLQLIINDNYNFGMVNVNITDQLKGSYQLGKCAQKSK